MKKKNILSKIALTIALLLFLFQSSISLAADYEELALLNLINNYRQEHGLAKLEFSETLAKAAHNHSVDMANKDYFSHNSLNGYNFADRIAQAGYSRNTYLGENIAAGMWQALDVFRAWQNSAGHNSVMLGKNFKAVGISRAYNSNAKYEWYWTADFGGIVDSTSGDLNESESWGIDYLLWLAKNKGLKGYPDGTFRPNNPITRAEFAVMSSVAFNINPGGKSTFKDVKSHWARAYIAALADRGILSGYADGKFRPNELITRAEIASIITKAAGLKPLSSAKNFNDTVGHWAQGSIVAASSNNIITGYANGKFKPDAVCIRGEAAAMLCRLIQ